MRGLNKVSLIGNIGREPVAKKLTGGIAVTKISLATSSVYTTREGLTKTETQWHTVIFWNKLAELAAAYLKKGMLVFVEGELRTRQFEDKQGHQRYVTEIFAGKLIMLESSKEQE